MHGTVFCFQANYTLSFPVYKARGPDNCLTRLLTIRSQGILLFLQPALTEFRPARFLVTAIHPRIAQARPVVPAAHRLASPATPHRRIELEIGAPLHRRPPELQIIDPPATLSALDPEFPLRIVARPDPVDQLQRTEPQIAPAGPKRDGRQSVDQGAGDDPDQEQDQGGVSAGLRVVLLATHLKLGAAERNPDPKIQT